MRVHLDQDAFVTRLKRAVKMQKQQGINLDQVATLCDIPKPTLESYLYRQFIPGANSLARLGAGLNVSVDWLLFGEKFDGETFDG